MMRTFIALFLITTALFGEDKKIDVTKIEPIFLYKDSKDIIHSNGDILLNTKQSDGVYSINKFLEDFMNTKSEVEKEVSRTIQELPIMPENTEVRTKTEFDKINVDLKYKFIIGD